MWYGIENLLRVLTISSVSSFQDLRSSISSLILVCNLPISCLRPAIFTWDCVTSSSFLFSANFRVYWSSSFNSCSVLIFSPRIESIFFSKFVITQSLVSSYRFRSILVCYTSAIVSWAVSTSCWSDLTLFSKLLKLGLQLSMTMGVISGLSSIPSSIQAPHLPMLG